MLFVAVGLKKQFSKSCDSINFRVVCDNRKEAEVLDLINTKQFVTQESRRFIQAYNILRALTFRT